MVEEEVKEVMPTLLPSPKWKKEQKNLKVGDVVQMCYSGNVKDNYRLAKLVEVFPDRRNLVRTVRVKYICYCHNQQLKHKVEVLERDMEKEEQKVVGLEKKVAQLEGGQGGRGSN